MEMIIGRFYFRLTESGNLVGEFSNQTSLTNSTESADKVSEGNGFEGEFITTWRQDSEPFIARLIIRRKSINHRNIFGLEWRRESKVIYWGEGLIEGGILIGDYRNFERI